ncbi:nuclear transport factor 2 family protein [Aeromicrobium choanae]|uniref:Ketosteroid isomerase-related protein n=1 Tax=Aeromicrobium choanae TaxID=1736691 RepID=A0A1T4Z1A5_9ACTN|nr:hypothetical protein [Aeromicrobium choanae]SKB07819.1 hypothetical protein SAMN06295964_1843 [Aeromicrobium choanae]
MTEPRDGTHPFLRALDRLTAASEVGDEAAFAHLFSPDATIWQSTVQRETSVPEFVRILRILDRTVTELQYVDRRVDVFESGAVEQHVLEGTRMSDRMRVRLQACVVVRFDERGLIRELREYIDSGEAAEFVSRHRSNTGT